MDLDREERGILAGERGEAARRALEYQIEVGRFWGARRFGRVTNVHMMGDIEVMGDGGLDWLRGQESLGARCVVATTTNVGWTPLFPRAAAIVLIVSAIIIIITNEILIPQTIHK